MGKKSSGAKLFRYTLFFHFFFFITVPFFHWWEYALEAIVQHSGAFRAIPIERFLERADIDPELKEKLSLVSKTRKWGMQQFSLQNSKSYSRYFPLGREELGFILTVAPPHKLEAQKFSLPLLGNFGYLGFFDRKLALQFARRYASLGFDVHLSGMAGYSSLGILPDPLFSSAVNADDEALVRLILHELTHERVYYKGDTFFSERIAVFVEKEASHDALQSWEIAEKKSYNDPRSVRFRELILTAKKSLQKTYEQPLSIEQKKAMKQKILSKLYLEGMDVYGKEADAKKNYAPEHWNNAWLLQIHRYSRQEDLFFKEILNECDRDWHCFFAHAESWKKLSSKQRADLLQ